MITARALSKLSVVSRPFTLSCSFISNKSVVGNTKSAMGSETALANIKSLFLCGVSAVQPENLFRDENITLNQTESTIMCNFNEKTVTIKTSNSTRCHLVGFGKAVYGMASELAKKLDDRLKSGIISVPLNIHENFGDIQLPGVIKVYEGAKNNLPDENAECAAFRIVEFTKTLTKDDILFVLISGGGSALLPLPCEGVTLCEKLDIIKKLASKGATISDINRVRIDLSQTKGGKLANCAKNAVAVIVLIISDIIGDSIHLIASGPTVILNENPNEEISVNVLKRFELWYSLPEHIKKVISEHAAFKSLPKMENIHNLIIASNEIAVNAVVQEITNRKLNGVILSTAIEGNVIDISQAYFELGKCIQSFRYNRIDEKQFLEQLNNLQRTLCMRESFLANIQNIVNQSKNEQCDFCVIGAGEPTVEVTGNGIGGRNQELALRFSQHSFNDNWAQDVFLLSAGTDGIDGPTTAAGAIGGADIIRNYLMIPGRTPNDIDDFVQNNDSFRFYSNLCDGKYHIVTGHTGTNVMDVHLLYFKA